MKATVGLHCCSEDAEEAKKIQVQVRDDVPGMLMAFVSGDMRARYEMFHAGSRGARGGDGDTYSQFVGVRRRDMDGEPIVAEIEFEAENPSECVMLREGAYFQDDGYCGWKLIWLPICGRWIEAWPEKSA